MTSKSLSLDNPLRIQKQLINRKLWLVAVFAVYRIMAGPILATLVLGAARNRLQYTNMREDGVRAALSGYMQSTFGFQSALFFMVMVWAVIFALQAFAFLFDARKMDFYESQPLKRDKRFFHAYVNAFVTYAVIALAGTLLTAAVGLSFGALQGGVFAEMLLQYVQELILFLAGFGIAALGALVSGNVVIGFLAGMFFFLAEAGAVLIRVLYMMSFLPTFFQGAIRYAVYSSPLYYYLQGYAALTGTVYDEGGGLTTTTANFSVWQRAALIMPAAGKMLVLALVAFLLCLLAYRKRKTESAGDTIVFQPVRFLVKLIVAAEAGLVMGIAVSAIIGDYEEKRYGAWVMMIILFAFLAAVFMEAIFELDIKALFKKPYQIVACVALPLLVFFVFRTGCFGYDRYLPSEAQIESFMVTKDYYSSVGSGRQARLRGEYYRDNMMLTDVEAGRELMRIGEEYAVAYDREEVEENMQSAVIMLRLKNGKNVYRQLQLPEDLDAELMDRIIGTEEYTKARFPYLYDDTFIAYARDAGVSALRCQGVAGRTEIDKSAYEEFAEAYRKDLANYNYSIQQKEAPMFGISVSTEYRYYRDEYAVYSTYSNTLAFLKAHGVETDPVKIAQSIEAITINDDGMYGRDEFVVGETGEDISLKARRERGMRAQVERLDDNAYVSIFMRYDDPEQIRQVAAGLRPDDAPADWAPWSSSNGMQSYYLGAMVSHAGGDTSDGNYTVVTSLLPDYVLQDLGLPR